MAKSKYAKKNRDKERAQGYSTRSTSPFYCPNRSAENDMTTTDPRPAEITETFRRFAVEMAAPAPLMIDCPRCGGDGEVYSERYDRDLTCCECLGSGSVPAMCSMPRCERPATMTADGQLWCDECGHPDEDHATTGLMAALAAETIRGRVS